MRFPDKELAVEENLAALGRLLLLLQDYSSNRYVKQKTPVNQKLSYQLPEKKLAYRPELEVCEIR